MTGVAKHSDEACPPGFLFSEFREQNMSSLKSLQQHQGHVGVKLQEASSHVLAGTRPPAFLN